MTASAILSPVQTKTCSKCGEVKPTTEFHKKPSCKDGLHYYCKSCRKATSKANYAKTGDKQKEKKRAEYWADPEAGALKSRQNYEKHKEAILLASKDQRRNRSSEQIDKRKAYQKAYYDANKQSYLDGNNIRRKKRIKTDKVFALKERIRTLINLHIHNGGYTKKSKSKEILGCTWDEFKRHIERQFTKGMSWEGLGEIHLDHIIPVVTAKTEDDVIRLNHFTNLRPMWAKDNLAKGAQITHLI